MSTGAFALCRCDGVIQKSTVRKVDSPTKESTKARGDTSHHGVRTKIEAEVRYFP